MKTWTDVTYKLGETDHLMVCVHSDCVSLGLPGYMHSMTNGRGLYIYLTPAHLAELRKAVANLEDLLANQQHNEAIRRSLAVMEEYEEYNGDPTCAADGHGEVA